MPIWRLLTCLYKKLKGKKQLEDDDLFLHIMNIWYLYLGGFAKTPGSQLVTIINTMFFYEGNPFSKRRKVHFLQCLGRTLICISTILSQIFFHPQGRVFRNLVTQLPALQSSTNKMWTTKHSWTPKSLEQRHAEATEALIHLDLFWVVVCWGVFEVVFLVDFTFPLWNILQFVFFCETFWSHLTCKGTLIFWMQENVSSPRASMGLVYLPTCAIENQPNVGKYTSPMDGMDQKLMPSIWQARIDIDKSGSRCKVRLTGSQAWHRGWLVWVETSFLGVTLPETNSSPLKMDGWKMSFLLGPGLFSGVNC